MADRAADATRTGPAQSPEPDPDRWFDRARRMAFWVAVATGAIIAVSALVPPWISSSDGGTYWCSNIVVYELHIAGHSDAPMPCNVVDVYGPRLAWIGRWLAVYALALTVWAVIPWLQHRRRQAWPNLSRGT